MRELLPVGKGLQDFVLCVREVGEAIDNHESQVAHQRRALLLKVRPRGPQAALGVVETMFSKVCLVSTI